ncbi:amidohydrolase family protein [Caulobacter sp. LARHSG274]
MFQIADCHAHVVTADRIAFPPVRADDAAIDVVVARNFDTQQLLGDMTAQGVGQALLVQRGQIYGFDNSYICEAAAKSGGRLKPVCAINARQEGCGQVAHDWRRRGATGFRLMAGLHETGFEWLDGPYAKGLWDAAADWQLPMCVHLFPKARSEGLERLIALTDRYPKLPIVVDHLTNVVITGPGETGIDDLLRRLAERPNVILKFTTIPLGGLKERGLHAAEVLRAYIALVGPERLTWGSDVTQSAGSYAEMVALARDAVGQFDAATQRLLLAGTVMKTYGLDQAPRI